MGPVTRPTALLTLAATVVVVNLAGRAAAWRHTAGAAARTPPWAPPPEAARRSDNVTAAASRTRRVAVHDLHGLHLDFDDDDGKKDDVLLARLQRVQAERGGGSVRPPMHKATLTQIGYIQFLRYIVDVPELRELSFCVWLRSRNLTHNHPIFSYSKNEKERLARAWVSPPSPSTGDSHGPRLPPRLHLAVMERTVFVEPLPEAAHKRWLHICPSWDGRSGQFHLHVDGRLRRAGSRAEVSGFALPGGGDVVVGQEYTDFNKGLDDGVEGDVFGFHLFRTATPRGALPPPSENEHDFDEELQRQLLRTRRRGGYYPSPDDDDAALLRRQRPSPAATLPPPHRRRSSNAADDAEPTMTAPRPKRQGWRQDRRRPWWAGPHSPSAGLSRLAPPRVQRLFAMCEEPLAAEDRHDAVVAWRTTPVRVFGGAIISNVNRGCGDF